MLQSQWKLYMYRFRTNLSSPFGTVNTGFNFFMVRELLGMPFYLFMKQTVSIEFNK